MKAHYAIYDSFGEIVDGHALNPKPKEWTTKPENTRNVKESRNMKIYTGYTENKKHRKVEPNKA